MQRKSYRNFRDTTGNVTTMDLFVADVYAEDIPEDPEGTGRYEDIDKVYKQYKKDMSENPRSVSRSTDATLQALKGAVNTFERKCVLEKNIDPDNSYSGSIARDIKGWLRETTRKYKNLTVIR